MHNLTNLRFIITHLHRYKTAKKCNEWLMLSECIEDAHMRKKRRAFVVAYQIQRLLHEHENGML